jgi:hypothetical protein
MNNSHKIILDLCGGTGSWSKPYKDAGYDVRLITLPEHDVRLYIPPENVYGILAAPPCTVFANSGARWSRSEDDMREGLSIMDACLRIIYFCKPKFWALENPIGKMKRYLGQPKMYFNPCDYGDPYTKKTCLWGEFAEPVKTPVEPIEGSKLWRMCGGKSLRTKELRSITPPSFAQAFFKANQ